MIIRKYITSFLAVSALIFGSVSCSNEDIDYKGDSEVESPGEDDGMVDVTISFSVIDLANISTRDGEDTPTFDLTNIDLMIYSVRDENDNVLTQYGKGVGSEFMTGDKLNTTAYPALEGYHVDDDNNQTLMKVNWEKKEDGTYGLHQNVTLRVMRNKVYKFSCWAQSSQTRAYDFNYLTAVRINYENADNNDENRDAFCSTSIFSIGQVNSEISITLTRPCAQINVGVESNEENDKNENWSKFNQSSITLYEVAKYFNVVENRSWSDKDIIAWENRTFGVNYNEAIFDGVEKDENGKIKTLTNAEFKYKSFPSTDFTLNNYSGWTEGKPDKKTYKSLSMCYVFVPEAAYEEDSEGNIEDSATAGDSNFDVESGVVSPTLKNVTIKLKSFSVKGADDTEVSYPGDEKEIELEVKRNWRTNLLFSDWSWVEAENPTTNP